MYPSGNCRIYQLHSLQFPYGFATLKKLNTTKTDSLPPGVLGLFMIIPLTAVLAMGHGVPDSSIIKEPIVAHEAACDREYDHRQPTAGDTCLQAADEWSAYAAIHQADTQVHFYELLGAITRVQTCLAYRRVHRDAQAFSQMSLAVSISQTVAKATHDELEVGMVNEVARMALKLYPSVWGRSH